jgi:hypothetical protein
LCSAFDQPVEVPKEVKHDQGSPKLGQGPTCSERQLFWDRMVANGLLAAKNLILAGDLNFTTGADEVWGATTQLDKL